MAVAMALAASQLPPRPRLLRPHQQSSLEKLNPAPTDPMQAKIMKYMPVAFTVFFLWFPAGLVLYWVINNILSIAQQWVITKSIEKADPQHS